MDSTIDKLTTILEERNVLAKEEERLEQQIQSLHQKLIMTVVPKLQEIYRDWKKPRNF